MSVRTERRETIESGSPLGNHSLNQRKLRASRDLEEKAFGWSKKDERVARRIRKEADENGRSIQDWYRTHSDLDLTPKERFDLAVERVADGIETDEDIAYLLTNDDDFEAFGYRVDRFTFSVRERSEATTIVEFTRQDNVSARKDAAA